MNRPSSSPALKATSYSLVESYGPAPRDFKKQRVHRGISALNKKILTLRAVDDLIEINTRPKKPLYFRQVFYRGAPMRLIHIVIAACLAFAIAAPATIATANDAHHSQTSKQSKSKKATPDKKAPKRTEIPHFTTA